MNLKTEHPMCQDMERMAWDILNEAAAARRPLSPQTRERAATAIRGAMRFVGEFATKLHDHDPTNADGKALLELHALMAERANELVPLRTDLH